MGETRRNILRYFNGKSAKLYMLKDKLSNFKMKDDESILEMFYWVQVIINNLKSLNEKVKDEDFSHKFLMCLPTRFKTLRTIIFRGGLKDALQMRCLVM